MKGHYSVHPAVFVAIEGGKARVVVMSTSFYLDGVPPHLRGEVIKYFPEEPEFDGTMKDFLTRERMGCSILCSSWTCEKA